MIYIWLWTLRTQQSINQFNHNINQILADKQSNETCTNSNECGGKLLCEDGVCQCPIDLFWNGSKCIFSEYWLKQDKNWS